MVTRVCNLSKTNKAKTNKTFSRAKLPKDFTNNCAIKFPLRQKIELPEHLGLHLNHTAVRDPMPDHTWDPPEWVLL